MTIPPTPIKVGVMMQPKKYQKHGFHHHTPITPHHQFIFIHLTWDDLLQGPHHLHHSFGIQIILQKVSDLLPEEWQLDLLEAFEEGPITVVDRVKDVLLLSDRWETCQIIDRLTRRITENHTLNINNYPTLPQTIKMSSVTSALHDILTFPVIRKPVAACSVQHSHSMCLFPTPNSLTDPASLDHSPNGNGYILQQFIPHHGILYKVYVIGEEISIQIRPSLQVDPLQPPTQPTPFNSQSFKHKNIIPLESSIRQAAMHRLHPHLNSINQYTAMLRNEIRLTIFGWDLIVEEGTDRLFIIDVNYFPGCDEVEFMPLLANALSTKLTL